jgi:hypothetical protein
LRLPPESGLCMIEQLIQPARIVHEDFQRLCGQTTHDECSFPAGIKAPQTIDEYGCAPRSALLTTGNLEGPPGSTDHGPGIFSFLGGPSRLCAGQAGVMRGLSAFLVDTKLRQ